MHLIEVAPVTQIRPFSPVVAAVQTKSAVKTAELQIQFAEAKRTMTPTRPRLNDREPTQLLRCLQGQALHQIR